MSWILFPSGMNVSNEQTNRDCLSVYDVDLAECQLRRPSAVESSLLGRASPWKNDGAERWRYWLNPIVCLAVSGLCGNARTYMKRICWQLLVERWNLFGCANSNSQWRYSLFRSPCLICSIRSESQPVEKCHTHLFRFLLRVCGMPSLHLREQCNRHCLCKHSLLCNVNHYLFLGKDTKWWCQTDISIAAAVLRWR